MYHKSFKHISRLDKKNKQTPIPYIKIYIRKFVTLNPKNKN